MINKTTLEENKEYMASIIDCTQAFILEVQLPKNVLKDLQKYSRDLFDGNDKIDMKNELVGEIESGEELQVDKADPLVEGFAEKLRVMAHNYIKQYQTRVAFNKELESIVNEKIWVNSYKKGDYNPFHDHGTHSPMGLSWFLYLKVPEDLNNHNASNQSHGAQKYHDGCTAVHWGYNFHDSTTFVNSLLIPPLTMLNPCEGNLYMFPKWMKHQVYPHKSEQERISMAGNISIY